MTPAGFVVTRVGDGVYRVAGGGRQELVYVAGPPDDRWAFWNGRVYRADLEAAASGRRRASRAHVAQSLSAPMPATVVSVSVAVGAAVTKGETLVVLEAMKMELPLRSPSDAVVTAVRCRPGDLVAPGTVLVEIE